MLPFRQSKPVGHRHAKKDVGFEIEFFEGVAQRDPNYIEALQILGDAYTKTRQLEKGLHIDKRLAKLCPGNPLVFYNLACSFSLMQKIDNAFVALEKAVRLGYKDARWLKKDPDLANLRQDHRFAAIQRELR